MSLAVTQQQNAMQLPHVNPVSKIRPVLQRDGGDVKFVSMSDDGVVKVELQGACAGCPGATMTLKNVIEQLLKKEIAEVRTVISV